MTWRVHVHWPRIFACTYAGSSQAVCTSCSAVCFSHFWLLDPVQASSLLCVLQSVWKQQLLDCRKQTFVFFFFVFTVKYLSSPLNVLSAFLSCRLPEEVWWGLWLVSSGYFQLPDGGQWSRPAFPNSRMKSETWNSWNGMESEQISFQKQWEYTKSEFLIAKSLSLKLWYIPVCIRI